MLEKYALNDDGAWLHYFVNHCEKPTLVFIHGAGGNHTIWKEYCAHFQNQSYILVDVRGHGKSTARAKFSLQKCIDDVKYVLSREKVSDAVIVGTSLGSSIAAGYAMQHPEQVRKLVLICPFSPATVRFAPLWRLAAKLLRRIACSFPSRRRFEMQDYSQHTHLPALFHPLLDIKGMSVRLYVKAVLDLLVHEPKFAALPVPTIIVWGKHDFSFKKKPILDAARVNPLIRTAAIPGNHLAALTAHAHIIPLIDSFVKG